jgi:hypothetical protein
MKRRESLPDPSITMEEEIVAGEEVGDVVVDLWINEHSAEDSFLSLSIMRELLFRATILKRWGWVMR